MDPEDSYGFQWNTLMCKPCDTLFLEAGEGVCTCYSMGLPFLVIYDMGIIGK